MANRRDFLKLFGVGSLAVPLIGGMPDLESPARIIVPPVITGVEYSFVSSSLPPIGQSGKMVIYYKANDKQYRFIADNVVMNNVLVTEPIMSNGRERSRYVVDRTIKFELHGTCLTNELGEIANIVSVDLK